MSKRSLGNKRASTGAATNNSQSFGWLPALAVVMLVAGFLAIAYQAKVNPSGNGASTARTTIPSKPSGTETTQPPSSEQWNLAQGLPKMVTRFAFSFSAPTLGYATVFKDKQTQDIYTTSDAGTTWQQIGSVQSPVCDIFAVNPGDPQDAILASIYVPAPGVDNS